jgi:hypothetical protein
VVNTETNHPLSPLGVLFTFLANSCYLMSTAPSNEFLPESARCHTMDIVSRLTSMACSPIQASDEEKIPKRIGEAKKKGRICTSDY